MIEQDLVILVAKYFFKTPSPITDNVLIIMTKKKLFSCPNGQETRKFKEFLNIFLFKWARKSFGDTRYDILKKSIMEVGFSDLFICISSTIK